VCGGGGGVSVKKKCCCSKEGRMKVRRERYYTGNLCCEVDNQHLTTYILLILLCLPSS
jgi:hypothetical protein